MQRQDVVQVTYPKQNISQKKKETPDVETSFFTPSDDVSKWLLHVALLKKEQPTSGADR